ncbi:lachesin-like protein [Caerostris extrusa]|uniref:Lachesin-like protein n=1 Tax=Caerostris extrusa TaxID=172846 RepID=A0AAV4S9U3_CAEEX|nr:lachesin-like protein [Caerostris extrusa]
MNICNGFFQVAWIRVESQTILTIHKTIISRNYRITLNHKDHRHYNLHITNVQEQDRGSYMCQINTVPMKKQIGYLDVVVPPQFNQSDRSTEVLAREGTNVTLSCAVTGHPQPIVTWQRKMDSLSLLDQRTIKSRKCRMKERTWL